MYKALATLGVLCFMAAAPVAAQQLKQRMADRYEQELDYPRMAKVYEDIIASGKGSQVELRKLAGAYLRMDKVKEAATTYAKLLAEGEPKLEDMHVYADLQRGLGNYTQANEWYQRILDRSPEDATARAYLQNARFYEQLDRVETRNKVRTVPINSAQADMAPAIMGDLLLFGSARGEGVGGKTPYKWDGEPFLNLHTAKIQGVSAVDPLVMRKEVNSRYHDGGASYEPVGKRLYFTRDNLVGNSMQRAQNGELKLGIYVSSVRPDAQNNYTEWGPLEAFVHNDPEYNYGHPYVHPGEQIIWFVSDRPGGFGGTDIWYCLRADDTWGPPINAGPSVNTVRNEMYPFVSGDSVLYFASNGQPGLGGYDLFMTRLGPSGPGLVFNLGAPINTKHNDAGLVLMADDSTGFFFSDRPGGVGGDDIYGCTVYPPRLRLAGRFVEKGSGLPLNDVVLDPRDGDGRPLDVSSLVMGDGGTFNLDVDFHPSYVLAAAKNGFRMRAVEFDHTHDLENIVIELERYDLGAEGIVRNGNDVQPLQGALVRLMHPDGTLIEEVRTNEEGKYMFALQHGQDYRISAEKDGYFRQSTRISTRGLSSTMLRTDFLLYPLEVDQVVRLDNIYYDVAKWNIRPDAAVELDKFVQTLEDNPTIVIELSSHTDCRGKDAYNLSLSEKRARSAADYVISKGIAKERIVYKGYGESKPLEECECTKCSDDEHQRNRRTEFKVLSM